LEAQPAQEAYEVRRTSVCVCSTMVC